MKDKNMAEIAQKLGVAKSTVSRTLRHCSGVDADTRRTIFRYMDEMGHTETEECSIYAILPDTPTYFWGALNDAVVEDCEEHSPTLRQHLYNTISDHDIVLRYLDEAAAIRPRALIVSAEVTPEIREKLYSLKDIMAVFLLAEYETIPYTFYIGADPYGDGFRMGEYFLAHCPHRRLVMVTNPFNPTVMQRVRGFSDALRQADPVRYREIPVHDYPIEYIHCEKKKLASARLASVLASWMEGMEESCLYVPFGTLALQGALQKAKFGNRVICFTHDALLNENGMPDSCIAVTMNQDVRAEGREAFRAAAELIRIGMCPDQKYTFIPSKIYSCE